MPPSAADVTNTYLYDPYGVTEHQTGTQYNPWQFAGGYLDASTLYYKYGTRYYDRFGRWTQQDPVPSANPYLYTNDDPVNVVDPTGMFGSTCEEALVFDIGSLLGVIEGVARFGGFLVGVILGLDFATGPFGDIATALALIVVLLVFEAIRDAAVYAYNDIAGHCGFSPYKG